MSIKKRKIRVFEGFAGYGGASYGLKRLKEKMPEIEYEVVGYSEFDKFASALFDANHKDKHGKPLKNWGDITKIDPNDLPDFDMFMGGFPCQPFSSAGMQMGIEDPYGRGAMLGHIIRICKTKKPKYLFLENVKGFTHGKFQPIHDQLIKDLKEMGYGDDPLAKAVLNSKDYGIPQNRERLWIFGYLGEFPEDFTLAPPHLPLQGILADFLDPHPTEDLYKTQAQIDRIHDIHHHPEGIFDVDHPMCYDIYNRKIRTDDLCMTITPPEHNVVRIVEPMINGQERFRKLSLDEHFRLMGFRMDGDDREILFPPTQDYTRLGRRAGNGWDVNLVGILFNHIFLQLL